MAGRTSVSIKAKELGIELDEKRPEMKLLIEELKEREFRGYEYEAADASFRLLIGKHLGQTKVFFEVENYRVIIERHGGELWAEATVKLKVNGEWRHTVAEETGPISALDKALRLALEKTYPQLRDMKLRDYKVRILEGNRRMSVSTPRARSADAWVSRTSRPASPATTETLTSSQGYRDTQTRSATSLNPDTRATLVGLALRADECQTQPQRGG
jgi:hypothetical protein